MNESDIVCVATTPSGALAHAWRNALEKAGIECEVGEPMTYWIDNALRTQADLWVHRANCQRAREILEPHLAFDWPRAEKVSL